MIILPVAAVSQSVTLYSVPSAFSVKVRSLTEAACKDATSNGNTSRLLNFICRANEIFTLQSTRNNRLQAARNQSNKNRTYLPPYAYPNHNTLFSP